MRNDLSKVKLQNYSLNLNGNWKLKAIGRLPETIKVPETGFNAVVPGTVHTDLMNAGVLPDPFYRANELEVQWVEDLNWEYSREFSLTEEQTSFPGIVLTFDGIDTVADIFLNNRKILHTQNMFTSNTIRVERFVTAGKNTLRVVIRSPKRFAVEREKKHGAVFASLDTYRVHIRKAQYSFGWDWGPRLATSGIWRNVRMDFVGQISIDSLHMSTLALTRTGVKALLSAKFSAILGDFRGKKVRVSVSDSEASWDFVFPLSHVLKKELVLAGARPWWTHDHGEPRLYNVRVEVLDEAGCAVSMREFKTGFREIKLLRKRDKMGESFIFELNGRKIFAKGADWIPSDSFLTRVTESDYRGLVKAARNANMNMLRVWGGGVYEDEQFYEACDENGLLVWQDFMFACASYPEYGEFVKEVEDEARENVLRISNHPCIALFCGNNESEWGWRMTTGRPVDEMPGTVLFKTKLRNIVREISPEVPYWRSSPFGGDDPDSQSAGNHHQWDVWSDFKPPSDYLKNTARFVTEFGFQAPPSLAMIDEFTKPEDRDMQSGIMRLHNKQIEGTERLYRFLAGQAKIAKSFEDTVLQMQLVQAKAIKTGVERWRTRKWNTAGTIFWQLNDCWPVSSWAAIDYQKHPKALYYWSKKFFKPVKVIITEDGNSARLFVVNDSAARVEATISIAVADIFGNETRVSTSKIRVGANSVKRLQAINLSGFQKNNSFIRARLSDSANDTVIDEDEYLLVPWLDFLSEKPNVSVEITVEGNRRLIRLETDRFVQGVYLPIGEKIGELSDNFFTLVPGTKKVVTYEGRNLADDLCPRFPLLV